MRRRKRMLEGLDREIRDHIEREMEDNIGRGMPPEEARGAALRKFGNITRVKEETREVWSAIWLEELLHDLRYTLRMLRKAPGFTSTVVLILALGIGATTAIFSVVNAVFLRSLPYKNPDRLVVITEFFPKFNRSILFTPEYAAFQRRNAVFENLGAFGMSSGVNLTGLGAAQRVRTGHVTPELFSVLGVTPAYGRNFLPQEGRPGGDRAAIISDGLWKNTFSSDPQIIGKAVILDGMPATVVGIMPAGFLYPGSREIGVWLPDALRPGDDQPSRAMSLLTAVGRLRPGVSRKQAEAQLSVIARGMDSRYPSPWASYHAAARPRVLPLRDAFAESSGSALSILFGAVACILLIACANVANLCFTRALTREREVALRTALGASRARLVRLVLTEALLLAVSGGVLGLIVAWWSTSALTFLLPQALPETVPMDARVFAFAVICSLATAILFGLAPAFLVSRLGLHASLKESGAYASESRSRSRFRASLGVFQLALSVVLLAGAGLMIRSFLRLLQVDPGFDVHNVLTAEVWLAPLQEYDPQRQAAFFRETLERIRRIRGVAFAAVTDEPPLAEFNSVGSGLLAQGEPAELDKTFVPISISPDYFRALRISLIDGRFFTEVDADGRARVVILNQTLAKLCFGSRDPVDSRVSLDDGKTWLTVVGVVHDVRHRGLDDKIWPELYQPFLQSPAPIMTFVLRTSSNPSHFVSSLRSAVGAVDRNQPLADVGTLEQQLSETLAQRGERTLLLAFFAAAALLTAAIGVYGVMSYRVVRRTHEIGIRMALGAGQGEIHRMVLYEGLRIALAGLAIGLAGSFALTRVLSDFLYGVTARDPLTFLLTSAVLVLVALFACYAPARRAMRVDPTVALRYE